MRRYIVLVAVIYLTAVGLLFSMAPDILSMLILGVMTGVLIFGFVTGIVPTISYAGGFNRCRKSIEDSLDVQSTESWLAVFNIENIFGQKELDAAFKDYKYTVEQQKNEDYILSDIEDYISEEFLSVRTWRGLTAQIPGTLTGLGILGTFIGLLSGIGSIEFSTVEAALESVSSLLAGIQMAFYTSVAGVILSILYNMLNHIIWNVMMREYDMFIDSFHKLVIPSADEQMRLRTGADLKEIVNRLDRIPKRPRFSLARTAEGESGLTSGEQTLMYQVAQGLENDEFVFYLQPAVELRTRKIVRAEALVRWQHNVLGLLPPSEFLPALERNGYITKLDTYIWESACATIRKWMDQGIRPVPITLNLSRMDIMAMDTAAFFDQMLSKYRIPPRSIELEIAQSVFVNNPVVVNETTAALRRKGFKVIMDGFDGDYIAVNMLNGVEADELKLDLHYIPANGNYTMDEIMNQAKKLGIEISAEEIENAEQVANLVNAECSVGQGSYLYDPMSLEEYEAIME